MLPSQRQDRLWHSERLQDCLNPDGDFEKARGLNPHRTFEEERTRRVQRNLRQSSDCQSCLVFVALAASRLNLLPPSHFVFPPPRSPKASRNILRPNRDIQTAP